ncbi:MAG: diphosphomevalonate decarboxylase [Candidatus ainarchaeum sp.]|nr:diphosphomevalonate decarboxylase [Candidatus ainarchaeum sp.]
MKATALANSNIALIKYWGRRDDELVLPANSSISFTMDEQLSTKTTVEFANGLASDDVYLDGRKATEKEYARVVSFLDLVRAKAGVKLKAKVVSQNTFPKSAGLASSASGFAALAAAASKALGLGLDGKGLSMLARRGSGSASRSIFGGCVEWHAGKKKDGSDCYAEQISPPSKWKDLRNIIALSSMEEKHIGSAAGMGITAKTSSLYAARLKSVGKRLVEMRKAVRKRNFEAMAPIIMRDSDSMHATMLDSWPPIVYLNETSFRIMREVLALNQSKGKYAAAYTFDAGPNAHIYTTAKYAEEIKRMLAELPGVMKIIECKIGEGIRFSEEHLF